MQGYLAIEAFFQGDEGFGAGDARDGLYFVHQNTLQVLVIAGVDLDEDGIATGDVMTLGDLGDLPQFIHYLRKEVGTIQEDANVGAGQEANLFWIHLASADACSGFSYHREIVQ